MGAVKNYLLNLICEGENAFAQDAIEDAITTGLFKPTCDFERDKQSIAQMYDLICDTYRAKLAIRETGYVQTAFDLPSPPAKRRPARPRATQTVAVRVGT